MKYLSICLFIAIIFYFTRIEEAQSKIYEYNQKLNSRPVIGILTIPERARANRSRIMKRYVNFIEQAGAQVVPLPYESSPEKLDWYMGQLNGILFTGGPTTYFQVNVDNNPQYGVFNEAVKYIIKKATEMNLKQNIHFPILGICLGMQNLQWQVGGSWDLMTNVKNINHLKGITKNKKNIKTSKFFNYYAQDELKYIFGGRRFMFIHNYAVLKKTFDSNPILNKVYKPLAYSTNPKGEKFIAAFEGRKVPFFGVQFHPERSAFGWYKKYNIDKSPETILIANKMSYFFVTEAKKNFQKFDDLSSYLISNFVPKRRTNGMVRFLFYYNWEDQYLTGMRPSTYYDVRHESKNKLPKKTKKFLN